MYQADIIGCRVSKKKASQEFADRRKPGSDRAVSDNLVFGGIIYDDGRKSDHQHRYEEPPLAVLGELTRGEAILTKGEKAVEVFDHDYPNLGVGKAIPHGIYDVKLNKGYLSIGSWHETAAFVVDNIGWWWEEYGKYEYPKADRILILCDSGGANGHRHHLFKKLLQELAGKIDKKLVIAHYPPYCSKYNPIERRLFAQVHRTIRETILTDLEQVEQLMKKTRTKTGLTVQVRLNEKYYPLKQPSLEEEIDKKRLLKHPTLPKLSYTILP